MEPSHGAAKAVVAASLNEALAAWRSVLGEEHVVTAPASLAEASRDTTNSSRRIPAIVRPGSTEEISSVVRIARQLKVPIYPVSTGRNWGYGTSNPARDGCVLVDLSRMNRILSLDPGSGLVVVEPGVTQGQLAEYLEANQLPFLTPVTGAGPDCSLLGNAMERGVGITPHADHFGAVTSLEAVLPDGSLHRSMLHQFGGAEVDQAFKWGLGPYLDGLFTQSNLGIVTQVTIALAPRPECVETYYFFVEKEEGLEGAVEAVRQIFRELGGIAGGINLMNRGRTVSMSQPYPRERAEEGLTEDELSSLAQSGLLPAWMGLGALYGSSGLVKAAKKEVRRILRGRADRVLFFTPRKVRFLSKVFDLVPPLRNHPIRRTLHMIGEGLRVLQGTPSEIALQWCYWKSGNRPAAGTHMDPARDGCGFRMYAPLVVMEPQRVRSYVNMVRKVCGEHRMEPVITLIGLSDRCFDSTVPLLFDRASENQVARAQACFEQLIAQGRQSGFVPWRLAIDAMPLLARDNAVPALAHTIKRALDPDNILAPGRYV